jgi:hypothetical protein
MKKQTIVLGIFLLFIVFTMTSCAPEHYSDHEYGFFGGIIHGMVFFFALIGKLFGADIGLYADNNTGFFYWLGFILGIGALGGGGAASRR